MNFRRFDLRLILLGLIIFLAGFGLAWAVSAWVAPEQLSFYLVGIGLLIFLLAFFLQSFFQAQVLDLRRLNDETKVIMSANSAHRLRVQGAEEVKALAQTINAFADRFQSVLDNQADQIRQGKVDLEEEKNRLAALMSELTEGVLVCNSEGRILLYNHRAKELLGQANPGWEESPVGGYVGLGRSVFGLIGRNTITQALEDLTYRRQKQRSDLVSQFVTTATNGQLIRVRIALILAQAEQIHGFVLTLEDITQQSQRSRRRDMLLQALTEGVRASLANIRTAIETIEQYPHMDSEKLSQLRHIIYDEALGLSTRLNDITTEYDTDLKADWQLEEMLGSDLLWAIQRRFEDNLEVSTTLQETEDTVWLKVDSYAVVQAMSFIMQRLKVNFGITAVNLCLKKSGQLATFDLAWQNGRVDMDTLWSWQNEPLSSEGEGTALTLREVAEHHGGEVWCQADRETGTAFFRLLLSTTQPKTTRSARPQIQHSRPEYYDFDLFRQPDQTPELESRPLTELTYTVFDTETTGLNPSGGDEIISVSAVRIVNGRLLRQEIFDQLVDPQRSLSRASMEVHGISAEMLTGQPVAEQVLPLLFRFSEGTVLVAHNAAFDMRMLQLKEAQTGLKFTNPVLDTLLLSAVIHPNQKDHSLEAIAERLGINITGRHTSLGDAILTGEIFLKQIALLADQGIITFGDARRAAEKTFHARLKY